MIWAIGLALAQLAPGAGTSAIPASAKAVVDHVNALYKGDIPAALQFVSDTVENSVSDGKSNIHFPAGKVIATGMYAAITRKGKLSLTWFDCRPEDNAVRCEMLFGTGKAQRNFTMHYFAFDGPITRIYSWENHGQATR